MRIRASGRKRKMDIKNPSSITNLSKWTEKTVEMVRRTCNKQTGPCLVTAMLFLDATAPEETRWKLVVQLAADPNNPIPEEERKKLNAAMEHIMGGAMQLLDPAVGDEVELSEYAAKGSLH